VRRVHGGVDVTARRWRSCKKPSKSRQNNQDAEAQGRQPLLSAEDEGEGRVGESPAPMVGSELMPS
jgi:hypothetical protein